MLFACRTVALLSLAFVALAPSPASAQTEKGRSVLANREQLNQAVIGLVAGRIEGAPLRLAAELARALDDGDKMRVIPMVSRGPFDNINDLIALKGVDAAIVNGDVLRHFKTVERIPNVDDRINYVARLAPAEVHILVRPEINSIEDLAGKKVNFNTKGTAAAYTGPLVFELLGIKVEQGFIPHNEALEQMRKGSDGFVATFWITNKPIGPLANPNWPEGFKFLNVEYKRALEEFYLPATLESKDYPKLIKSGERVQTISVPTVLAVYNWKRDQARYWRMAKFVDYLFERLPELQKAPYDPSWKDVNLASTVPGWRRYEPVQRKLQALGAGPIQTSSTKNTAK
jgi:TRAP-type uncharacterized transport system substrate-binding protein